MADIIDKSIVTIYDTHNDGAEIRVHRIDAREFLKSPRWSAEHPETKAIADHMPEDDGETMRLKAMSFKELQAAALKAEIPNCETMKKAELVEALKTLQSGLPMGD